MQYSILCEVYEKLESTTKRLEKTHVLSEFLKKADDIETVALLVRGRVYPEWETKELGMAAKLILKAISTATGATPDQIEKTWRETGDIGITAEQLTTKKTQATLFSQTLMIQKVFDNLRKLSELEGTGTVDRKVQLTAELLTSAKPNEAKYIVRTILGELRVGLGDGTVRDSIVWAFFGNVNYDAEKNELKLTEEERKIYDGYVELVQEALDVANDFALVAKTAKQGEHALREINLMPSRPTKMMLYQKAQNITEAFETVGKPAAIEQKYDGFRLQIHKFNGKIKLYTRRLENVTEQFPDVVKYANEQIDSDNYILDAEAVGIENGKYLPFQNISQRIKRKYDIEETARKYPVQVNIFDALYAEGKNLLKKPFSERRKILEKIVKNSSNIKLAEQIITEDIETAEQFYSESLNAGNEGIMVKNLTGLYKPGSRVGYGVKVKPVMDTLEVAIVGAEWGEGKRGQWLSSFVIAVRNTETNEYAEIGRVGTGIKEKTEEGVSFDQLTQLLLPIIIEDMGKDIKVKPEVVIEVNYEEIQKSPTYASGYALRFPRFVKLRTDRSAEDINTVEDVKQLAESQRGRGEQK